MAFEGELISAHNPKLIANIRHTGSRGTKGGKTGRTGGEVLIGNPSFLIAERMSGAQRW